MIERNKKVYLGDGLYAHHDGYHYVLSTDRGRGPHWVGLDPQVLQAFLSFVEKVSNVKITVKREEGGK